MVYFLYILASKRNGTLYVGITSNLLRRVTEHREDKIRGFTNKYSIHSLVYYEILPNVSEAIRREKQIKKWKRQWKLELTEKQNSDWKDLFGSIL